MEIDSQSSMDAWRAALRLVVQEGSSYTDSRGRRCVEYLGLLIKVRSPRRVESPKTALCSFDRWICPSTEEIAASILSKDSHGYFYGYGERLFAGQMNQLDDYIIPLLKADPATRRAVAVAWNPSEDAKISESVPKTGTRGPESAAQNLPGVIFVDFKLRGGALHVTTSIRSNDIFFGWPANIYRTHVLQKYVADKLGARAGTLSTFSNSAHVFEDQREMIERVLPSSS